MMLYRFPVRDVLLANAESFLNLVSWRIVDLERKHRGTPRERKPTSRQIVGQFRLTHRQEGRSSNLLLPFTLMVAFVREYCRTSILVLR